MNESCFLELFHAPPLSNGVDTRKMCQVLRRACEDARAWPADIKLAVNISPIQLRDETLGLRILAILGQTGFDPRRLEIEITEGKNRQIRRMTAAVGHPTLRLIRCRIGNWGLDGLAPGSYRPLPEETNIGNKPRWSG